MKNSKRYTFHTKHVIAIITAFTITLNPLLQYAPVYAAQSSGAKSSAAQKDSETDSSAQTDTSQTSTSKTGSASDNGASDDSASKNTEKQDTTQDENTQTEKKDSVPAITSIEPLSEEETYFSFERKPSLEEVTALFPAVLSVHMDNDSKTVSLPVSWECEDNYEDTESDVYEFTPSWDTAAYPASAQLKSWNIPSIIVSIQPSMPDYFLTDVEKANSRLASLAKSKNLLALIYLCDSYEIKKTPGADAPALTTVSTGQSVLITGVSEDSENNIWYQVKININDTDYTGYVERKYLAYSDEDFIAWEEEFVSINMARSATPMLASEEGSVPADIRAFPASYQNALIKLKEQHPNWIFVNMQTGVDWNTAVKQENSQDRSLISSKSNAAWKTSAYDDAWSYPTDGILAYYMDPRNFLTENYIFQFELLSYNPTYHTEAAIQDILKNTFMSGPIPNDEQGRTYSQAFYSIAKNLVVSPFHLASRVRQEQGDGKSPLISGTYQGYTGLYNYFNIGATGKGSTQIIENGLAKAKEYGWTTRYLSLAGGADIISKNYIRKGQDTLYLQKFNVNKTSASGLYNHQYMQNIAAPSSESLSVKNAYASAGSIDNPFVFRIPVYENMPSSPCAQPADVKSVTLDTEQLTLKADETFTLTVSVDGKTVQNSSVSFSSSDPKTAVVDGNGTITAITAGTAKISCTVSGGTTAVCTVTVQKIKPTYTVPVLDSVSYDPNRTLQNISLPTGWTWENPSIVPVVGNPGYPAVYTPADTSKYETVKQTLSLTVTKGTPAYTVPSGLQTAAGNTLADIKLPAGFTWEQPDTALKKAGTFSYPASYNPDAANYQTVTGISIPITVTEKAAVCTTHNYGEWVVTTPASCTKAGARTRSCHLCGTAETESIPATGHSYTSAITRQATENETGIRTYTCSICGDTYTEEIAKLPAAHKHNYTASVTTAASCGKAGVRTYTCSCGDTYTEVIPALAHNYTSSVTKEATETEAGVRTYTCSICQDTYTESIPKLPSSHKHSYTSSVTKQPTCTEKGVKTYVCSCGDTYSEDIAALGHDMSEGKCRRCGYTDQTQNIAAGNPASGNSGANTSSTGNSNNSGNNNSSGNNAGNNSSNGNTNTVNNNSNTNAGNNSSNSATGNNNSSSNTNTANNNSNNDAGNNSSSSAPSAASNPDNTGSAAAPDQTANSQNQTNTSASHTTANSNTGSAGAAKAPTGNTAGNSSQNTGNVTIDMQKTSVLYEETLSALRGRDVTVILNMGNNISWTLNGRNIVADEANGIDMGVHTDSGNIPADIMEQAAKLSGTGTAIELSLSHDGSFEFQPILTFHTDAANAGRFAALFYHNPETERLEYIDETTVTETGDILFTFSHASDYVIIISDSSLSAVNAIDASGIADTAENETASPEGPEVIAVNAAPAQEDSGQQSGGFHPPVLLIILLIILALIAIGCTAFLIFHSKDTEDEDEEPLHRKDADQHDGLETVHMNDEDDEEEIFYIGEDSAGGVLDEDSAEDDYYEPDNTPQASASEDFEDGFDGFE